MKKITIKNGDLFVGSQNIYDFLGEMTPSFRELFEQSRISGSDMALEAMELVAAGKAYLSSDAFNAMERGFLGTWKLR